MLNSCSLASSELYKELLKLYRIVYCFKLMFYVLIIFVGRVESNLKILTRIELAEKQTL